MECLREKLGDHVLMMIEKMVHVDKIKCLNKEYHETYEEDCEDDECYGLFRKRDGFGFNMRDIGVKNMFLRNPNDTRISLYIIGNKNTLQDGIIRNFRTWNERWLRGKFYCIPKRYIFSSGSEYLKGYNDKDVMYQIGHGFQNA